MTRKSPLCRMGARLRLVNKYCRFKLAQAFEAQPPANLNPQPYKHLQKPTDKTGGFFFKTNSIILC